MPPPTKRPRTESAGSGALHEDDNRQQQAKAGGNKRPRKDGDDSSLLKAEWDMPSLVRCGLSKRAQGRHIANEVRARFRAIIPGPRKLSDNGLMLQAASTIKDMEMEIHSLSNHLERLEQIPSSGGSSENKLKDQRVEPSVLQATDGQEAQATDGEEALRDVLPQATRAKGTRLLESAWGYWTELQQERTQLKDHIVELDGCTEAKTPCDRGK